MELITITESTALLDKSVADKIVAFERRVKELKAKEEQLKTVILQEMEKRNIKKLQSDDLQITYIEPGTKETFDSKTLRAELPEIYNAYTKISDTASYIKIKVS